MNETLRHIYQSTRQTSKRKRNEIHELQKERKDQKGSEGPIGTVTKSYTCNITRSLKEIMSEQLP